MELAIQSKMKQKNKKEEFLRHCEALQALVY